MPAYHDIDNESCHASRHLLTEVLRDEWGFDGLIVADYIGISLLYQHHNLARDRAEAAAMAFNAGLDIELPADDCAAHLGEAVGRGLISMETIDAIVRRILTEKIRLGLFERPYVDEGAIELQAPATVALAREVARQASWCCENDGVLPLDPARGPAHRPDRSHGGRPAGPAVRLQLPGAPHPERRGRGRGRRS